MPRLLSFWNRGGVLYDLKHISLQSEGIGNGFREGA